MRNIFIALLSLLLFLCPNVSHSISITRGAIASPSYGLILNGGFEIVGTGGADIFADWGEATTGTSTVNRDTIEKHGGSASCRYDIDAIGSGCHVEQFFTLIPGKRYRFILWYKNGTPGSSFQIYLSDIGSNVYLKTDGTWGVYADSPTLYSAIWTSIVIDFITHPLYSDYRLAFQRWAGVSCPHWFDDVSLLPF